MIDALAPDRSDQPFGKAILPRRGWRSRPVPDAHSAQSASNDAAIDPIPIADEVARRLIPRKSLGDLTRNPFGRRICSDVDPDKVPAVEPDDDEGIEHAQEVRHPWLGGPRRSTMYLATLDCAISNPSLSSSPCMRGAPQSGFSTLIRRISTRRSVSICGRPPRGRDFQRQ